jgi:TatD DNase family protein
VIDTHAHLDACDEPVEDLLRRARAAGVSAVITIGTGIASSRWAAATASEVDGVFAAVGIDPHRALTPDASRVAELRPLLELPGVVAVGETGLDGHYDPGAIVAQRVLLDEQLALAEEHRLPVVIHSRDAEEQTADALAPFTGPVVLHCFSSPGLLDTALERGYYVSFAGNVSYPRAIALREAAASVPRDRLLAETDAPYLPPQPVRGRRNEPGYVSYVVAALADARGEDAGGLAAQIDANAREAFSLP